VFAHEIGAHQTLVIQVRLTLSPPAGDWLDQTVDYNLIADHAQRLGRERIGLIETFARRLAEACLAHEGVSRAEVAVAKPGALRDAVAGTRIVLASA
jgi:dihydroneopterin aldolase